MSVAVQEGGNVQRQKISIGGFVCINGEPYETSRGEFTKEEASLHPNTNYHIKIL